MSELKLKRNFAILIWLSCVFKDLKERNLKIKDLPTYFCSLFRVVFCRMKYIGINTKWATDWYWVVGSKNLEFKFEGSE
ncbi:hypothetical protein LCGC14_0999740 [marine sediment metagenome]|uniref:Uncharacterized protein n=1 Tax=marine sediment metagenome TaxID=412755 RepID=A0A0F9N848_9ZZZZ|nr:MAG: hypothetical protein Lokiarch_05880 [Candidatus Lokiarchaeum sp. GC14_75]